MPGTGRSSWKYLSVCGVGGFVRRDWGGVGGRRERERGGERAICLDKHYYGDHSPHHAYTHTHTRGELRRQRGCTASGARVNGQGRGRHSRGREGWRKASCLTLVVAVPVHDVVCHWLVLPLYGVCEWCGWK